MCLILSPAPQCSVFKPKYIFFATDLISGLPSERMHSPPHAVVRERCHYDQKMTAFFAWMCIWCAPLTLLFGPTTREHHTSKIRCSKILKYPRGHFFTSIGISLVSSLACGRIMRFLCCLMSCVTSLGLQMTRWICHTHHCKEKYCTESMFVKLKLPKQARGSCKWTDIIGYRSNWSN